MIELNHDRAFCPIHGEPYRADYPRGYPMAMVLLARAVLADKNTCDSVMAALEGKEVPGDDAENKVRFEAAVQAALDVRPACCRISDAALRDVYKETLHRRARCAMCHRLKRLGAPFKTTTQELSHVCVDCVMTRFVPKRVN